MCPAVVLLAQVIETCRAFAEKHSLLEKKGEKKKKTHLIVSGSSRQNNGGERNCLNNLPMLTFPNFPADLFVLFWTYLFHQLNAGLEIHTEIHEDPLDTLLFVLFLLKNKHVMVEKLLQLLVGEVDAELLETVELFTVLFFVFWNEQRGGEENHDKNRENFGALCKRKSS